MVEGQTVSVDDAEAVEVDRTGEVERPRDRDQRSGWEERFDGEMRTDAKGCGCWGSSPPLFFSTNPFFSFLFQSRFGFFTSPSSHRNTTPASPSIFSGVSGPIHPFLALNASDLPTR